MNNRRLSCAALSIRVPEFNVNAWPVRSHVHAHIILAWCPRRFVSPVDT